MHLSSAFPMAILSATLLATPTARAENGLVSVKSSHDVARTVERLEAALKEKEVALVAKVDHAAGAARVGEKLRPTVLLVFGNPKLGTPLLQCAQTAGIDLPQKALVWQDEKGQTWLTYNDPRYIASRHAAGECGDVVRKTAAALEGLAAAATKP
jgi:uncharacterized protein (DUF302 family)